MMMIVKSHAIVQPRAMMIHFENATLTNATVVSPLKIKDIVKRG